MPIPRLTIVPQEQDQLRLTPNNLPAQPTRLIGREHDITAALALITSDEINLLTLVGPGGVGKTRLSLQLAEEMLDDFEDGVYFIEVAPITDPDLVTQAIAGTLQIREEPGTPILSTLKAYLQGKKKLLVLDNFEQVIPAGRIVSELLAACRDLKLIVTSRSPLKLRSEQLFTVSPLSLPEKRHNTNPDTLSQYGSIALFTERAKAVKSDFELTDSNSQAVSEICCKVDGIPLGIELVAAYAGLLTPHSLLSRLTRPLRMMTEGALDSPVRHQTMRDTIEWSYNLLDEDEQRLFRSLGVFVGSFALRSAEAVCNLAGDITIASDAPSAIRLLRGLKSLVDKNLLRRLEQNEDEDEDHDLRLAMLETVREYAWEQLALHGETPSMQRRHADYYVWLAGRADQGPGLPLDPTYLAQLNSDYSNVRAALTWLIEQSESGAAPESSSHQAIYLIDVLDDTWSRHMSMSDYRILFERLLAVTLHEITSPRAWALIRGSLLTRKQTDFRQARLWAEEAISIARQLNEPWLLARGLNALGGVAMMEKDYDLADALSEEALEIFRTLGTTDGKRRMLAMSLSNIAMAALHRGNYQRAESLLDESCEILLSQSDKFFASLPLTNLGYARYHNGDPGRARESFLMALMFALEADSPKSATRPLVGLGCALLSELDMHPKNAAQSTRIMVRATELLSAASVQKELESGKFDPFVQANFDKAETSLRSRLGEQAFNTAWSAGRTLTPAQILGLANATDSTDQELIQSDASNQPMSKARGKLTNREYEIAILVARGMTSAEVARQLILSERTVEMHVANAMQKLNLHRRTELAAWIVQLDSTP